MTKASARLAVLLLLLITAAVGVGAQAALPDGKFHFQVLNVGQGDAILVTTPQGVRMLVDGGPGDNVLSELGSVLPFLSSRIDLVLLTHPDADHLEGLIPVLRRYDVQAVIRTDVPKSTAVYKIFNDTLAQSQALDERLYAGDVISVSDGTKLTAIWPLAGRLNDKEVNETSLVAQLAYGGYKFLLTGDIGEVSETQIAAAVKDEYLNSDVLKVAHHGSGGSSSSWFLSKVDPRVALISAGKDNFYGHPTEEALGRLSAVGADILRTDVHGRINIEIDKDALRVKTEK